VLARPSPAWRKDVEAGVRGIIDLNEDIERHGRTFRPLVRESYALHCGLKIQFQRKEPPGRVYQGGDIDGRIKTLLDALTMPQHLEQVLVDPDAPATIFCLMEDDSMVSGLQVESERLLTDQNHPKDHVRLNIEVDVRVRLATIYNQSFLGWEGCHLNPRREGGPGRSLRWCPKCGSSGRCLYPITPRNENTCGTEQSMYIDLRSAGGLPGIPRAF
jgi:hypothetical protein